jgi:hypothetical protein
VLLHLLSPLFPMILFSSTTLLPGMTSIFISVYNIGMFLYYIIVYRYLYVGYYFISRCGFPLIKNAILYVFRILAILIQIIAVVINTALVDELVNLLDENIPLAKVTLVATLLIHP